MVENRNKLLCKGFFQAAYIIIIIKILIIAWY